MTDRTQKGMWKRTIGLYRNIRLPWLLYLLDIILGIISTRVALLYIPYEAELKLGNIEDLRVAWAYLGLMLLITVTNVVSHIPAFYSSAIVTRSMQDKLINHALRLPMRSFEKNGSQIVSWITQDCASVNGLVTTVIGFITGAASVYMSVTAIQGIDTSLAYLVPFVLVYIIFSTWLEGKLMFLRQRRGKRATAELTAYFSEHLSFFTQIKQLHSRQEELARSKKAIDEYYRADVYQALLTLLGNVASGSLTNVIDILIFVLGVPMVNEGRISLPELAAFQQYILVAYQNLSSLPSLYTQFMYYNGELFYISSLMEEKEEVYQRQRTMDMKDEDLVFDHVSFAYGEKPVIRDASFTIPKGKVTMIAGPNGSGKTTLFKLIERFYTPDSGTVRFGGRDAEEIHLQEWRQSIAYVLQDPQLFDGTIRENINYGMDREVSPEETESAAKLAGADEFIRELPGGYDFVIGENGGRLSGGQRQRLAIARAVMLDPAYLLLDEATCNMDVFSERAVNEALRRLMKGRTTVMISHDMKMLNEADHVVVLNQGAVEAEGSREEAERSSELLQRMVAAEQ